MSSLIDRRDPTRTHLQMDSTTSDEEQGSTLFSPATLASRVIPVKASLTEPLLLNDENDGKQTKIYQHGNNRKRKNLIAIAGTALFVCLLLAFGSYRTLASPGETVDEMMVRFPTFTKSSTGTGLRDLMLRNNAHLTTDKPIYRGGDRLHWRAVIVDAFHGPPPTCNDVRNGQVTFNSPKGDTVFTESVYGQCHFYHPIQYGNIAISNEWVGGDYTLTFTSPGVTVATRTINIRKYAQPPALTIRSDFQRKGYTANETVIAYVHVSRREGGMPVGAGVTAYVTIDGQSIYDSSKQGQSLVVDIDGDVEVKFQLPEYIHTGIGTLTIVVDDSGVTASSGITIPILLASLDVITYPSSGWLVDGILSRVYYEAHTPLGEPADMIADVMWIPKSIASKMKSDDMTQAQGWNRLDAADWSVLETITQTTTLHEGRGMFEFTPHAKNKWNEDMIYALRVTSPVGIQHPIWLDEIQSSGIHMYATKDTFTSHEPVTIQVSISNRPVGIYHICLHQREQVLICQDIQLPSSMGTVFTTLVKLTPPLHLDVIHPHAHDDKWQYVHSSHKHHVMEQEEMSGVLRVTLHGDDDDGMNMNDIQQSSLAGLEILIFRHPPGKLLIHVNTSLATVPFIPNSYDPTPTPTTPTTSIQTSIPTSTFAPRQTVNVTVRVTDESGRPVPSLLAMAVVDDSVIQMVETRKQAPRLMEQIYLDNEVQDLSDAHIYLSSYHTPHQSIPSISEKSSRTTTPEHALNLLLNTQGWRRYAYINATFMENAIKQGKNQEIKAKQMYGWSDDVSQWMWTEAMPRPQYHYARTTSQAAHAPRAMAFHAEEAADMGAEAMAFGAAAPPAMEFEMMNQVADVMMADEKAIDDHVADININEMTEQEKKEIRRMRRWGPDKGRRDEDGKDQQEMEKKKMGKRQNKVMDEDEEDQAQDRAPDEPILAKRAAAPVQDAARYVQRRWYDPREYRHVADTTSTTRSDMTQTVFWSTSRTYKDGLASFTFSLSDAITSYRLMIDVLSTSQFAHIVTATEPSDVLNRYDHMKHSYIYGQDTNVQLEKGKTRGYRYGQTDVMIQVKEPFYIQPTFPFEVTGGDHVILPISLINNNAHAISVHTNLSATYEMKDDDDMISPVSFLRAKLMENEDVIVLMGGERGRTLREMLVAQTAPSNVTLTISSAATPTNTQASPSHDSVSHTFATVPAGYPIIQSHGGMLKEDAHVEFTVKIPKAEEIVGGLSSILSGLKLYPSPAANLMQALEALIREPYGCFEQTSATTYPLVMVLQYYRSHSGVDAEKINRVMKLLENGYSKLTGYECSSGGFEWFGQSPGHEALTAYGLAQFLDMAKVYPVDSAMIRRTADWILSRQHDHRKGFQRNQRALDQFGAAPEDITDAYIIWSLTYAGIEIPDSHIFHLVNLATSTSISSSTDSYFIGLVAGILYQVGDKTEGHKLAQKLISNQQKDGSVINAKTSITNSGGDSLLIETTSIAVLVWLNDPEFAGQVELAIRFLTSRCADGKFGSTQGTVLALKAIIAYDKYRARNTAKPGAVRVMVDGVQIGEDVNLGASADDSSSSSSSSSSSALTGIIQLPDISSALTEGEHTIRLELAGGASIPYSATFRYHSIHPSSKAGSPLTFTLKMNKQQLMEGEGTQIDVQVINSKHQGIGMVAAIIGLPSGLEPRHAQLQELVRANKMSFYEINGRYVVLYWRGMGPDQHIHFPIDVVAILPGEYTGQASQAYEYYHDEQKVFVKPLHVKITPIQ